LDCYRESLRAGVEYDAVVAVGITSDGDDAADDRKVCHTPAAALEWDGRSTRRRYVTIVKYLPRLDTH
jgi:hypothetical protein